MPAPTTGSVNFAPAPTGGRYEHLHLHLRRTHWETKYHENLGTHLQDALDTLDREGWEVVTAFCMGQATEVILRRPTNRGV
jgi:hypothetical protein